MIELFILYWLVLRAWRKRAGDAIPLSTRTAVIEPWADYDETRIFVSETGFAFTRIAWDALISVMMEYSDEDSAFGRPLIWLFAGPSGEVKIPEMAEGMKRLAARVQELPAFDLDAFAAAKSRRTTNRFILWQAGKS